MFGKKQVTTVRDESSPMAQYKTADTGRIPDSMLYTLTSEQTLTPERGTVIAVQTVLTGEMDIRGDCRIFGSVQGTLRLTEGTLSVMKGGRAEGEIHAQSVVIDGFVTGNCYSPSVEIRENGELRGLCCSERLSVMNGGIFLGVSERMNVTGQTCGSIKEEKHPENNITKDVQSEVSEDNSCLLLPPDGTEQSVTDPVMLSAPAEEKSDL